MRCSLLVIACELNLVVVIVEKATEVQLIVVLLLKLNRVDILRALFPKD